MIKKITQQAQGTEYGVIQSLLLGGPAGDISKRWSAVKGSVNNLMELANGLPAEFQEYFMMQAAPAFGVKGMDVQDMRRMQNFTGTRSEFESESRKERLGQGMGTEKDYLAQIAEAVSNPDDLSDRAESRIGSTTVSFGQF